MNITQQIETIGKAANIAQRQLEKSSLARIDKALEAIAQDLEASRAEILEANKKDLALGKENGIAPAMLERLSLEGKKFDSMVQGVRDIIALPNPVGETLRSWQPPNELKISKVRVPIGVIGIIYESRPNVTVDAAVLCLKTANAVILRGGSEAFHSNTALSDALRRGLKNTELPEDALQFIPTTDREAIKALAACEKYVDLLIPRGGEGLIRAVMDSSRVPVIKHYNGICHVYVEAEADFDMAEKIVINAKCQRPGVCNAMETLLIDEKIAESFLPRLIQSLIEQKVEVRGDARTREIVGEVAGEVEEADWDKEYLELILSVRVVKGIEEAIEHIDQHGSHHTDVIVTRSEDAARRFFIEIDSATVCWNASSRFADGGEFGFGAEIGISTDKIHARGPMGLEELTSYKYLVTGDGNIRT